MKILAGAEGFEPPTTGFGDQRSTRTELRPYVHDRRFFSGGYGSRHDAGDAYPEYTLARLAVYSVLPAPPAVLAAFYPIWRVLLVLHGCVVPALALGTRQCDDVARHARRPSTLCDALNAIVARSSTGVRGAVTG